MPRAEYGIDLRLVINSIEQICVLVSFAFAAARVHLLQPPGPNTRSRSRRGTTFAVMLAMSVVEEVVAWMPGPGGSIPGPAAMAGTVGALT